MDLREKLESHLRSSEELLGAIQAVYVLPTSDNAGSGSEAPESCILAVVSHKDELTGAEEGSIFLFERKHGVTPDADDSSVQLDVKRIFPIVDNFSITMTQSQRDTVDLRASYPVKPLEQSSGGFLLNISTGASDNAQDLQLLTHDIKGLRLILDECKKLKSNADAASNDATIGSTYSWIAPYVRSEPVWSLSSVPRDLRLLQRPLHEHLSEASAGFRDDEEPDVQSIMDSWLYEEACRNAAQGKHTLSLRIGTFNVNGKLPSQDLSPWLQDLVPRSAKDDSGHAKTDSITLPPLKEISPFKLDENKDPLETKTLTDQSEVTLTSLPTDTVDDPDLIVLGFQEVDLSTEALIYSTSTVKADAWGTAVFAALGDKAETYEKFASKQLVGMLIIVIAKKSIISSLGPVHMSSAGVGLMGFMGNKGAVGVRIQFTPPSLSDEKSADQLRPTTLTFVNSHLAAFDEMIERRNQDFHEISNRLTFNIADSTVLSTLPVSLYESDAVFWMGDLNYRIDVPDADVREILKAPHWPTKFDDLLQHDQLRKTVAARNAFEMFKESPVAYAPTYRFSHGVLTDDIGYDVKRRPAWCDRILHLSNGFTSVKQLSYRGHPEITQSDHKPVSATFSVEIELYSVKALESSARRLHRQLKGVDATDWDAQLSLEPFDLDFGNLKYLQKKTRVVSLENKGKVARAFRFIPLDPAVGIHPKWLSLTPTTGIVLPGATVEIEVTAFVDDKAASELNMQFATPTATLALHVLFGKEHFVAIHAQFDRTCFANSIPLLVRLPGPIRTSSSLLPEDRAVNAPREIMRLINWLMTHCQNHDDLFRNQPDPSHVEQIVEALDTGNDFPFLNEEITSEISIAVGETLVRLLDSMTEPVIPTFIQSKCTTARDRDTAFELLDELSPPSVNVWISLTAFLHYLCESSSDPPSRACYIASIFASILMKDATSAGGAVSPLAKYNFLLFFLT